MKKRTIVVFIVFLIILAACGKQTPTVATPTPVGTPVYPNNYADYSLPIPDLYKQISDNYASMTKLQYQEYSASLVGKRVHLEMSVTDVRTDGMVELCSGNPGSDGCVLLEGLPKDMSLKLTKFQTMSFDGTIEIAINPVLILKDPVVYFIH